MHWQRIKISNQAIIWVVFLLSIILLFGLSFYAFLNFLGKAKPPEISQAASQFPSSDSACVSEEKIVEVRGDSLSGLIESGQKLKLLAGYYKCNPVMRNDIVIYNYPGSDPLIKVVKGIAGDKFRLEKAATGCWQILINNEILKNNSNQAYCLSDNGYRMLALYEKDYRGIIPENAYLILGNQVGGTLDSSRFGLVGKDDIIGKVIGY